jgi:hypothetical protein
MSADKEKEKALDDEQNTSEENGDLRDPTLVNTSNSRGQSHQDGVVRQLPASSQESTEEHTSGENAPAPDLLQLFENRVFENQLIQLISERMDHGPPPPISRRNSDDALPAYRSTRG